MTHSFVQAVAFQGHGILCDSCLDDFESGMRAIDANESVLDRLVREHTIRARMPRFGLKPEIRLHPVSSKPIDGGPKCLVAPSRVVGATLLPTDHSPHSRRGSLPTVPTVPTLVTSVHRSPLRPVPYETSRVLFI